MNKGGMGKPITTKELIHRLRLMADSGGMLTRDRLRVLIEAADRLEDIDERIAIMTEHEYRGGDGDEEG